MAAGEEDRKIMGHIKAKNDKIGYGFRYRMEA